jgi:glutamyl-tRNA synthetase
LHLGHASTFWVAQERARERTGTLILRNEDLDPMRCKPEFVAAMIEDMHWFGLEWQEGPDCDGAFGPYNQSERREYYVNAFEKLQAGGFIYPCRCSRRDVARALGAPQGAEDEPIYPGTCRPKPGGTGHDTESEPKSADLTIGSWRFRVSDGEVVSFVDGHFGQQQFEAGKDFGDFVVWRRDAGPSYQLSVVVDDSAMQITEVVRGADLLLSTARQILIYRALNLPIPAFYHCSLVTDDSGARLAKRHDALSLRELRAQGFTPGNLRARAQLT